MELSNKTSVTKLYELPFERDISDAKRILQKRPNNVVQDEYFIYARINGEPIGIEEFEIGSRFTGGIAGAYLKGDEVLLVPLEGELNIQRYRSKFARRYKYPKGQLNLLVPEKDMLYIVQDLSKDKSFIQWAVHEHDREKQEIMEKADYAIFQRIPFPILPLVALINGSDVLVMGDASSCSTGYYKEVHKSE